MPLSQHDLALYRQTSAFYDEARKLTSAVDVRSIQRVASIVERLDPLKDVPVPVVPDSDRVPLLRLDNGAAVTIPKKVPEVVTARYSNNVKRFGFDRALSVAVRELVGSGVDDLDDDDRAILLSKVEDILSVEVIKWRER